MSRFDSLFDKGQSDRKISKVPYAKKIPGK